MERWIDCQECGKFGWMLVELQAPDDTGTGWASWECDFCGHNNGEHYDDEYMPGLSVLAYRNRVAAVHA